MEKKNVEAEASSHKKPSGEVSFQVCRIEYMYSRLRLRNYSSLFTKFGALIFLSTKNMQTSDVSFCTRDIKCFTPTCQNQSTGN